MERRCPLIDLDDARVAAAVAPLGRLETWETLTRGRVNTNVRAVVDGTPWLLRYHVREAEACAREAAVLRLVADRVPVPAVAHEGDGYLVLEWIDGTPLDEVLADAPPALGHALGRALAAVGQHRFERHGQLIGGALEIQPWPGDDDAYLHFVRHCLFDSPAGARLGDLRDPLWSYVESVWPTIGETRGEARLVHADCNPTNWLIRRDGDTWAVAALLDWEWAHSGPPLADLGNLLRIDRTLPPGFEDAVVTGYAEAGGRLPDDWRAQMRLLDIASATEFLSSAEDRPQTHAAALARIAMTLAELDGEL